MNEYKKGKRLKRVYKETIAKYLIVAAILAMVVIFFKSVKVTPLISDDGTEFAKATVLEVNEETTQGDEMYSGSQKVTLSITSGTFKGEVVEGDSMNGYLYGAYCKEGEKVIVQTGENDGEIFASVYNYDRESEIAVLVIVFLAVMWIVGGKKGINSVISLVFTVAVIIMMYLPMLYLGVSPFLAAVLAGVLITSVSMLMIGGLTAKAFCSIAGTVCGVVIAGVVAMIFGNVAHINGFNTEEIETLHYIGQHTNIDVGGLLFSGIIIASLGAVIDTAMSVATSLNEIAQTSPGIGARALFRSGMNIGRDMIGTMSNTLILAFVGGSLNTMIIIYAYSYSIHQTLNMYSIGIEIMKGISGSLGVILTVPFVSAVSAVFFGKKKGKSLEDGMESEKEEELTAIKQS